MRGDAAHTCCRSFKVISVRGSGTHNVHDSDACSRPLSAAFRRGVPDPVVGDIGNEVVCETSFSVSLCERKIFEKRFPYYLATICRRARLSCEAAGQNSKSQRSARKRLNANARARVLPQYQNTYYQGEPLPCTHYVHICTHPLALSPVGGATRVRPGDRFSSMY